MQVIGSFIQNQILGMKWLNSLIGFLLTELGLDTNTRIGGSVLFFIYDVLKITILLCVLIFLISYIQSYSLFIGFTSAGLPLGVTFSFLISSPMVDLGSLLLLMSIFGTKVAVIYVILGLVIAVAGGTLIEHLHMERYVEEFIYQSNSGVNIESPELTFNDRLMYARDQVVSTFKKVFPYILIGVGIGAVIHNWIPEGVVEKVLGDGNPLGVILATVIGIPMYADIFGTIPIAEALLSKGALLGVVLSFMMAVTTLSLPSLIMLRKAVKPKLLGTFIAICTVGIMIVGYFFNFIQPFII